MHERCITLPRTAEPNPSYECKRMHRALQCKTGTLHTNCNKPMHEHCITLQRIAEPTRLSCSQHCDISSCRRGRALQYRLDLTHTYTHPRSPCMRRALPCQELLSPSCHAPNTVTYLPAPAFIKQYNADWDLTKSCTQVQHVLATVLQQHKQALTNQMEAKHKPAHKCTAPHPTETGSMMLTPRVPTRDIHQSPLAIKKCGLCKLCKENSHV